jgi:hypothetical protein
VILDGLDKALEEATTKTRPRRRRRQWGWRQITAQVLYVTAVTVLVPSLLLAIRRGP